MNVYSMPATTHTKKHSTSWARLDYIYTLCVPCDPDAHLSCFGHSVSNTGHPVVLTTSKYETTKSPWYPGEAVVVVRWLAGPISCYRINSGWR
jgi:hypothetical protein